jgi:lysophospholipase L1-like esterase
VPTVPGAPTSPTATAGDAQAQVGWTAPSSNGGRAITGYVVTPYIGAAAQPATTVGAGTSTAVTGLTNGTAYTFKVAAINAVGTGAQSAASNAVTPSVPPVGFWIEAWGRNPLSTTVTTSSTTTQATVPSQVKNQTLRTMVWTTAGGSQVRVKVTNRFSTTPLVVAAAHVARRSSGGSITTSTDRTLTFGGSATVTVAAGAEVWSDPVTLTVPVHTDLAISLYLSGTFTPKTFHPTGLKTSYLSATGNYTASATMATPSGTGTRTTTQVLFVSEVQVLVAGAAETIVALGDSITDGACATTDANGSWPDLLSGRLTVLPDGTTVSVVNAGIGSNRFQASDGAGPSGIHRLPDLLALPNVKWVIVLEGINDISYAHSTAAQIIAAYQTAIAQAHAAGVRVAGVPILPIRHSTKDVGTNEATRETVNTWIRTSGAFDRVIDFEPVIADPADPLSIKSSLTCDHVHPNAAGYKAMANAIDLSIFNN